MDLWDLKTEDVQGYDMIYMDAVIEVLPNGDEALKHILSLKPRSLMLNRIQNGNAPDHFKTYDAYDIMPTYVLK